MKKWFKPVKFSFQTPYKAIVSCLAITLFISVLTMALTLMSLYIGSYNYADGLFESYLKNTYLLFLNGLPIFIFVATIFLLTNSMRGTFLLSTLFWLILSGANFAKIYYRHEIIKIFDYDLIQPTIKILPKYWSMIDNKWIAIAVAVMIGLLVVTLCLPKVEKIHSSKRISIMLVLYLGLLFNLEPYTSWDTASEIGKGANLDQWVEVDNNQATGFIYGFLYQAHLSYVSATKTYDKKLAKEIENKYTYKSIPDKQKVNVFVMLLESFKDFTDTDMALKFTSDPYEAFHRLQKESLSGHMLADVYGGGTIKSEVSVLTGYKHDVHHSIFHRPRESYVRYFKDNGYFTEGMHPNDGYFYNRANIYPSIGFDSFLYLQNYFDKEGEFEADHNYLDGDLFPKILERFHERPQNQPYFNYTATMQNHGPYGDEIYGQSFFQNQDQYDATAYAAMNNYLNGINNTGEELWKLTRAFENEKEPIIFICFGDHSPALSQEIYDILGLNVQNNSAKTLRQKIDTPYLIWANQAAKDIFKKSFKGNLPDSDPDLIMAQFFNYIGWGGTPYMQFLENYIKYINVDKVGIHVEKDNYVDQFSKQNLKRQEEKIAIERATRNKVAKDDK